MAILYQTNLDNNHSMPRFTFPRQERLRAYHTIRKLYKTGLTGYLYPFKYSYLTHPAHDQPNGAEVLIAISKKRIPKAVSKNKIRRRVREAYRLSKHPLTDALRQKNLHLSLIITFIGNEEVTWGVIHKKIVLLLQEIDKRLPKSENQS